MTKAQIELLRSAGISDEAIIRAVLAEEKTQDPEPKPHPEPAKPEPAPQPEPVKPEPAPQPEPAKPEPAPQPEPAKPDKQDAILEAINKLTGAVLNKHVLGSGQEDTPQETAEEIMGKLLRGR